MNNFIYDFAKVTAIPPGLIWLRPKWIYVSEKARQKIRGGALVISNHNGYCDPVLLMGAIWYRRQRFVCMKEFFEKPVSAFFFRNFHCIPIDRQNFGIGSFKEIIRALKAGNLVSIFPEGHIVTDDRALETFKSGVVLMALQGGVSIVPVYLVKRKNIWHRQKFVIGEPIDPAAMYGPRPTLEQMNHISEVIRTEEDKLKHYVE